MVLLHGFPGNHFGLLDLAKKLGGEYRIIIPDLPACGQSEELPGVHNLNSYAAWLAGFLENLSVPHAIIIGHSFGARVALVFSAWYPNNVSKLVLITPVVEERGFLAHLATLYYKIGEALPVSLQKEWVSSRFFKTIGDTILFKSSNLGLHKKIIHRDIKELKKIDQRVVIELFGEFYSTNLISLGKKVRAESLVIATDKDEIAMLPSVKLLVSNMDMVSLQVIKDAGHLVPLEEPSAVADIINSWLQNSLASK